jgi:hypothetical protein
MVWMFGNASSHVQSYCNEVLGHPSDGQANPQDDFILSSSSNDVFTSDRSSLKKARTSIDDSQEHELPFVDTRTNSIAPSSVPSPSRTFAGEEEKEKPGTCTRCCRRCRKWKASCKRFLCGRALQEIVGEEKQVSVTELLLGRKLKVASVRNLPPLFSVISHLVNLLRNKYSNSLQDFLELHEVVRIKLPQETPEAVALADLKNLYSQYTFLTDKQERQLKTEESKKIFHKFGFRVRELEQNEQPVAFIGICFKSERSTPVAHSSRKRIALPGESSLDFFHSQLVRAIPK